MPIFARSSTPSLAENASRGYGWPRLLLCFLLPGLLARVVGGGGSRNYIRAFVFADLALLATNVLVDHGPMEGLKQLPREAGLWPPRQKHQPMKAWALLLGGGLLVLGPLSFPLAQLAQRASRHPAGRFLNWRLVPTRRTPASPSWWLYLVETPRAVLIEECYIHGLLWSRMAWLGKWRPFVNAVCWAFYHLNRPVKDVVVGILPGALVASYARSFTGNIYWTMGGHWLSNTVFTWLAHRNLQKVPPSEQTSTIALIGSSDTSH